MMGSPLCSGKNPIVVLVRTVLNPNSFSLTSCGTQTDPGNPASQNKHGRAANRQLGNKTALRSGIWAKSALPPPPPPPSPPPSLARTARLAQLCSEQRRSAAAKPRRAHGLPVASAGSKLRSPLGSARSRFRGDPFGRILRVQGTRREGYTEFSLRVEGDPDFYKVPVQPGKGPSVLAALSPFSPEPTSTSREPATAPVTSIISCLLLAGGLNCQFLREACELQLPRAMEIVQSQEGTTVTCEMLRQS
ncbi:hypothetical protein CB1_001613008 [Camelus ferus]|nr:hypothetical protein CB1_001613008 [Camelus ferus]